MIRILRVQAEPVEALVEYINAIGQKAIRKAIIQDTIYPPDSSANGRWRKVRFEVVWHEDTNPKHAGTESRFFRTLEERDLEPDEIEYWQAKLEAGEGV